ncbi:thiamine transporter 1 [Lingula anatina]|uniref:Thiamine transporter 1 n=1 Tax=Lingula anatina TaxID=7574 RepID=A0A1S3J9P7_LINAN|nr:thiamine transporter 1 [Lingula anatina]|eukprot:XP_013407120.1 thiamine transporter 1 [Lingula anatina]
MCVSLVAATAALCLYGFLKELRPSESFLTPYLVGPDKNLSETQVDNEVYPVWTYSYLVALIVVFLLTDLLRYKPVIIFEGLTYLGTWALLLWGQGVLTMQLMQFLYGLATATEIAYYSYIYAAVEKDHYQRVTSYTRAAVLLGRFIAGLLGQLLVSLGHVSYFVLNCISMGSVGAAFIVAVCLPSVSKSVYFHQETSTENSQQQIDASQDPNREIDRERCASCDDSIMGSHPPSILSSRASTPSTIHHNRGVTPNTLETGTPSSLQFGSAGFLGMDLDARSLAYGMSGSVDSKIMRLDNEFQDSGSHFYSDLHLRSNVDDTVSWQSVDTNLVQRSQNMNAACRDSFKSMWHDFLTCYRDRHLLKWSLWWAFAMCGNFQVGNYIQNMWDIISPSRDNPDVYNGGVDAVSTAIGALAALLVGFVKVNWRKWGEAFLGVISILDAVVLLAISFSKSIWLAYGLYIAFRASFQMVITIASYQVASVLAVERYALVFGCNTFVAVLIQTIMTAILVDKRGLDATPDTQFIVYGSYFFVIGTIFAVKASFTLGQKKCYCSKLRDSNVPYREMDDSSIDDSTVDRGSGQSGYSEGSLVIN